jgi:hypothetical protein
MLTSEVWSRHVDIGELDFTLEENVFNLEEMLCSLTPFYSLIIIQYLTHQYILKKNTLFMTLSYIDVDCDCWSCGLIG